MLPYRRCHTWELPERMMGLDTEDEPGCWMTAALVCKVSAVRDPALKIDSASCSYDQQHCRDPHLSRASSLRVPLRAGGAQRKVAAAVDSAALTVDGPPGSITGKQQQGTATDITCTALNLPASFKGVEGCYSSSDLVADFHSTAGEYDRTGQLAEGVKPHARAAAQLSVTMATACRPRGLAFNQRSHPLLRKYRSSDSWFTPASVTADSSTTVEKTLPQQQGAEASVAHKGLSAHASVPAGHSTDSDVRIGRVQKLPPAVIATAGRCLGEGHNHAAPKEVVITGDKVEEDTAAAACRDPLASTSSKREGGGRAFWPAGGDTLERKDVSLAVAPSLEASTALNTNDIDDKARSAKIGSASTSSSSEPLDVCSGMECGRDVNGRACTSSSIEDRVQLLGGHNVSGIKKCAEKCCVAEEAAKEELEKKEDKGEALLLRSDAAPSLPMSSSLATTVHDRKRATHLKASERTAHSTMATAAALLPTAAATTAASSGRITDTESCRSLVGERSVMEGSEGTTYPSTTKGVAPPTEDVTARYSNESSSGDPSQTSSFLSRADSATSVVSAGSDMLYEEEQNILNFFHSIGMKVPVTNRSRGRDLGAAEKSSSGCGPAVYGSFASTCPDTLSFASNRSFCLSYSPSVGVLPLLDVAAAVEGQWGSSSEDENSGRSNRLGGTQGNFEYRHEVFTRSRRRCATYPITSHSKEQGIQQQKPQEQLRPQPYVQPLRRCNSSEEQLGKSVNLLPRTSKDQQGWRLPLGDRHLLQQEEETVLGLHPEDGWVFGSAAQHHLHASTPQESQRLKVPHFLQQHVTMYVSQDKLWRRISSRGGSGSQHTTELRSVHPDSTGNIVDSTSTQKSNLGSSAETAAARAPCSSINKTATNSNQLSQTATSSHSSPEEEAGFKGRALFACGTSVFSACDVSVRVPLQEAAVVLAPAAVKTKGAFSGAALSDPLRDSEATIACERDCTSGQGGTAEGDRNTDLALPEKTLQGAETTAEEVQPDNNKDVCSFSANGALHGTSSTSSSSSLSGIGDVEKATSATSTSDKNNSDCCLSVYCTLEGSSASRTFAFSTERAARESGSVLVAAARNGNCLNETAVIVASPQCITRPLSGATDCSTKPSPPAVSRSGKELSEISGGFSSPAGKTEKNITKGDDVESTFERLPSEVDTLADHSSYLPSASLLGERGTSLRAGRSAVPQIQLFAAERSSTTCGPVVPGPVKIAGSPQRIAVSDASAAPVPNSTESMNLALTSLSDRHRQLHTPRMMDFSDSMPPRGGNEMYKRFEQEEPERAPPSGSALRSHSFMTPSRSVSPSVPACKVVHGLCDDIDNKMATAESTTSFGRYLEVASDMAAGRHGVTSPSSVSTLSPYSCSGFSSSYSLPSFSTLVPGSQLCEPATNITSDSLNPIQIGQEDVFFTASSLLSGAAPVEGSFTPSLIENHCLTILPGRCPATPEESTASSAQRISLHEEIKESSAGLAAAGSSVIVGTDAEGVSSIHSASISRQIDNLFGGSTRDPCTAFSATATERISFMPEATAAKGAVEEAGGDCTNPSDDVFGNAGKGVSVSEHPTLGGVSVATCPAPHIHQDKSECGGAVALGGNSRNSVGKRELKEESGKQKSTWKLSVLKMFSTKGLHRWKSAVTAVVYKSSGTQPLEASNPDVTEAVATAEKNSVQLPRDAAAAAASRDSSCFLPHVSSAPAGIGSASLLPTAAIRRFSTGPGDTTKAASKDYNTRKQTSVGKVSNPKKLDVTGGSEKGGAVVNSLPTTAGGYLAIVTRSNSTVAAPAPEQQIADDTHQKRRQDHFSGREQEECKTVSLISSGLPEGSPPQEVSLQQVEHPKDQEQQAKVPEKPASPTWVPLVSVPSEKGAQELPSPQYTTEREDEAQQRKEEQGSWDRMVVAEYLQAQEHIAEKGFGTPSLKGLQVGTPVFSTSETQKREIVCAVSREHVSLMERHQQQHLPLHPGQQGERQLLRTSMGLIGLSDEDPDKRWMGTRLEVSEATPRECRGGGWQERGVMNKEVAPEQHCRTLLQTDEPLQVPRQVQQGHLCGSNNKQVNGNTPVRQKRMLLLSHSYLKQVEDNMSTVNIVDEVPFILPTERGDTSMMTTEGGHTSTTVTDGQMGREVLEERSNSVVFETGERRSSRVPMAFGMYAVNPHTYFPSPSSSSFASHPNATTTLLPGGAEPVSADSAGYGVLCGCKGAAAAGDLERHHKPLKSTDTTSMASGGARNTQTAALLEQRNIGAAPGREGEYTRDGRILPELPSAAEVSKPQGNLAVPNSSLTRRSVETALDECSWNFCKSRGMTFPAREPTPTTCCVYFATSAQPARGRGESTNCLDVGSVRSATAEEVLKCRNGPSASYCSRMPAGGPQWSRGTETDMHRDKDDDNGIVADLAKNNVQLKQMSLAFCAGRENKVNTADQFRRAVSHTGVSRRHALDILRSDVGGDSHRIHFNAKPTEHQTLHQLAAEASDCTNCSSSSAPTSGLVASSAAEERAVATAPRPSAWFYTGTLKNAGTPTAKKSAWVSEHKGEASGWVPPEQAFRNCEEATQVPPLLLSLKGSNISKKEDALKGLTVTRKYQCTPASPQLRDVKMKTWADEGCAPSQCKTFASDRGPLRTKDELEEASGNIVFGQKSALSVPYDDRVCAASSSSETTIHAACKYATDSHPVQSHQQQHVAVQLKNGRRSIISQEKNSALLNDSTHATAFRILAGPERASAKSDVFLLQQRRADKPRTSSSVFGSEMSTAPTQLSEPVRETAVAEVLNAQNGGAASYNKYFSLTGNTQEKTSSSLSINVKQRMSWTSGDKQTSLQEQIGKFLQVRNEGEHLNCETNTEDLVSGVEDLSSGNPLKIEVERRQSRRSLPAERVDCSVAQLRWIDAETSTSILERENYRTHEAFHRLRYVYQRGAPARDVESCRSSSFKREPASVCGSPSGRQLVPEDDSSKDSIGPSLWARATARDAKALEVDAPTHRRTRRYRSENALYPMAVSFRLGKSPVHKTAGNIGVPTEGNRDALAPNVRGATIPASLAEEMAVEASRATARSLENSQPSDVYTSTRGAGTTTTLTAAEGTSLGSSNGSKPSSSMQGESASTMCSTNKSSDSSGPRGAKRVTTADTRGACRRWSMDIATRAPASVLTENKRSYPFISTEAALLGRPKRRGSVRRSTIAVPVTSVARSLLCQSLVGGEASTTTHKASVTLVRKQHGEEKKAFVTVRASSINKAHETITIKNDSKKIIIVGHRLEGGRSGSPRPSSVLTQRQGERTEQYTLRQRQRQLRNAIVCLQREKRNVERKIAEPRKHSRWSRDQQRELRLAGRNTEEVKALTSTVTTSTTTMTTTATATAEEGIYASVDQIVSHERLNNNHSRQTPQHSLRANKEAGRLEFSSVAKRLKTYLMSSARAEEDCNRGPSALFSFPTLVGIALLIVHVLYVVWGSLRTGHSPESGIHRFGWCLIASAGDAFQLGLYFILAVGHFYRDRVPVDIWTCVLFSLAFITRCCTLLATLYTACNASRRSLATGDRGSAEEAIQMALHGSAISYQLVRLSLCCIFHVLVVGMTLPARMLMCLPLHAIHVGGCLIAVGAATTFATGGIDPNGPIYVLSSCLYTMLGCFCQAHLEASQRQLYLLWERMQQGLDEVRRNRGLCDCCCASVERVALLVRQSQQLLRDAIRGNLTYTGDGLYEQLSSLLKDSRRLLEIVTDVQRIRNRQSGREEVYELLEGAPESIQDAQSLARISEQDDALQCNIVPLPRRDDSRGRWVWIPEKGLNQEAAQLKSAEEKTQQPALSTCRSDAPTVSVIETPAAAPSEEKTVGIEGKVASLAPPPPGKEVVVEEKDDEKAIVAASHEGVMREDLTIVPYVAASPVDVFAEDHPNAREERGKYCVLYSGHGTSSSGAGNSGEDGTHKLPFEADLDDTILLRETRLRLQTPNPQDNEERGGDNVPNGPSDVVSELIAKLGVEWDVDFFKIDELTQGNTLRLVGDMQLSSLVRPDGLQCDQRVLRRFLHSVQLQYRQTNPYHNQLHAAMVSHCCLVIVSEILGSTEALPCADKICLCVAALAHDVGHPGFTNQFLVNTQSRLAITYNDRAVLENYHAACCFRTARHSADLNIFAGLPQHRYSRMRQNIIGLILATDMSKHVSYISRLRVRLGSDDFNSTQGADRWLLFQTCMKAADLAHVATKWDQHRRWADLLCEEVYRQSSGYVGSVRRDAQLQGDEEKRLGMPVMDAFDRRMSHRFPLSQYRFIQVLVMPLIEVLVEAEILLKGRGGVRTTIAGQVINNRQKWKELAVAGEFVPRKGAADAAGDSREDDADEAEPSSNVQQKPLSLQRTRKGAYSPGEAWMERTSEEREV